jgi:hypothetical protein
MPQTIIPRAKKQENVPTSTDAASVPPWANRRAVEQASRAADARRRSSRRRFVDPTVCERNYAAAETEFMFAMQEYKRTSGRMFPTWSEVLEVLRGLGYEKPVFSSAARSEEQAGSESDQNQSDVEPSPRSIVP